MAVRNASLCEDMKIYETKWNMNKDIFYWTLSLSLSTFIPK